ncbi:MAG: transposase [Candidatus Cloacimonetes bacterium]|nr:transposase [Candidatus Cloacimonadota bacterium]
MKSRYKIFKDDDSPYFLTLNVFLKIPIFTNSSYMNIILNNFEFYRKEQKLRIYAFVIMDNHIHLIASHTNDLSGVVRNLKSYSAKKLIDCLKHDKREWILKLLSEYKPDFKQDSTYQFWQEGNHPKQIQNIKMFNQKAEYMHYNPVKRGLVQNEVDWIYSSARNFERLKSVFQIDLIE